MSTESIHRQTVDEHGFFRLIVSLPVHGRSQSWSLTVIRTVGETKESPPGYPRLGDMCESGARPCKIRQNQVNSSGAPGTQRRRRDRLGDMTDGKPMPMPIRTLLSDECQEMGDGREAELFSTRPVLDQDMMVLPGRHYSALPPWKAGARYDAIELVIAAGSGCLGQLVPEEIRRIWDMQSRYVCQMMKYAAVERPFLNPDAWFQWICPGEQEHLQWPVPTEKRVQRQGEVWHPPGRFFRTPAANGPQRRFGQPANPPIPGRASTSLPPSPDIALQRLCPRPHWPRLSTNLQPATRTCLRLDAAPVAGLSPRSPHDDAQRRLRSRPQPRTRPAAVVPRRVARVETKNEPHPTSPGLVDKSRGTHCQIRDVMGPPESPLPWTTATLETRLPLAPHPHPHPPCRALASTTTTPILTTSSHTSSNRPATNTTTARSSPLRWCRPTTPRSP